MDREFLVCTHNTAHVVHRANERCPLCDSLRSRSGLIRLLKESGVLPVLPPDHEWFATRDSLIVLGPDMGHCWNCDHPPFPAIPLKPESACALR